MHAVLCASACAVVYKYITRRQWDCENCIAITAAAGADVIREKKRALLSQQALPSPTATHSILDTKPQCKADRDAPVPCKDTEASCNKHDRHKKTDNENKARGQNETGVQLPPECLSGTSKKHGANQKQEEPKQPMRPTSWPV